MLLCSPRDRRALNLPVFFGLFSLGLFASGAALVGEALGQGLGLLAMAALLLLLAAGDLRRISVDGGSLRVRNAYGAKALPLAELALAISVTRSSRGGSTYTVYALAGGERVDLAEAWSLGRAERFIVRLTETFRLRERTPSEVIERNRHEADRREASWREAERRSAAYVAEQAKSRRIVLWVSLSIFALIVSTSLTVAYFNGLL